MGRNVLWTSCDATIGSKMEPLHPKSIRIEGTLDLLALADFDLYSPIGRRIARYLRPPG